MSQTPDPPAALVAIASEVLSSGGTVDQAAEALMHQTDRPVLAIKALRLVEPGLGLAEAKHAIDRHMSAAALQARGDLLDQIERLILDDPDG